MLELTVGFMVYYIIEVYFKTLKFLLPLKLEVYPASKIIRYVCILAESWIVYIYKGKMNITTLPVRRKGKLRTLSRNDK